MMDRLPWKFPKEAEEDGAESRHRRAACFAALLLAVPAIFLTSALATGLAGWVPQEARDARRLLVNLIPLQGAMLLAVGGLFLFTHPGRRWLPALGLGRPPAGWRATVRSSLLTLAWGYPAATALYVVSQMLARLAGRPSDPSPAVGWLLAERNPLWLAAAVLGVAVLVPLAEELFFRLALHDALRFLGLPAAAAAFAASFAFAALHGIPAEIPALFFLGLLFQWRRRRDGSLWGAVLLHAGNNGLSLLFLLLFPDFFRALG